MGPRPLSTEQALPLIDRQLATVPGSMGGTDLLRMSDFQRALPVAGPTLPKSISTGGGPPPSQVADLRRQDDIGLERLSNLTKNRFHTVARSMLSDRAKKIVNKAGRQVLSSEAWQRFNIAGWHQLGRAALNAFTEQGLNSLTFQAQASFCKAGWLRLSDDNQMAFVHAGISALHPDDRGVFFRGCFAKLHPSQVQRLASQATDTPYADDRSSLPLDGLFGLNRPAQIILDDAALKILSSQDRQACCLGGMASLGNEALRCFAQAGRSSLDFQARLAFTNAGCLGLSSDDRSHFLTSGWKIITEQDKTAFSSAGKRSLSEDERLAFDRASRDAVPAADYVRFSEAGRLALNREERLLFHHGPQSANDEGTNPMGPPTAASAITMHDPSYVCPPIDRSEITALALNLLDQHIVDMLTRQALPGRQAPQSEPMALPPIARSPLPGITPSNRTSGAWQATALE